MKTIRIAVIDDHPVFREGVISILLGDPEFECIGEGGTADDAVRLAMETKPDIMLLDVSLPGGGINAVRSIHEENPSTRAIMLTVSESRDDVMRAFENGASGYVLKGIHKSDLLFAIRTVARGETFVDPSLAVRIIGYLNQRPDANGAKPGNLDPLTQREAEVLEYVSCGLSNKEIARNLNLSHRTVKNYMTSIMMKLQVRNRVEAALSVRDVVK